MGWLFSSAPPQRRLTPREVRDIRRDCASGRTQAQVAADFRVSQSTVSDIVRGKTWRDV